MGCMCVCQWMCFGEAEAQKNRAALHWVVETQLFYRSVLIPHSLSCWLTDRQHIVFQLHTHMVQDTNSDRQRRYNSLKIEFSRNQDYSNFLAVNFKDHKQYKELVSEPCNQSEGPLSCCLLSGYT